MNPLRAATVEEALRAMPAGWLEAELAALLRTLPQAATPRQRMGLTRLVLDIARELHKRALGEWKLAMPPPLDEPANPEP